ncbi:pyridoxal-phosphate dependent enzyme [Bacillus sp. MRMR6]|uniref:pyridoxal-phosphate dependent enzyme n=1 Tax=Bacillus sp. MRMR6 TaxID=1928617 RepID=UPI000951D7C4|nr:pyridoxal-phosphate dependent enzyme [Bacillus sp. MRMR6]OLS33870.1 hypothetical protein BTR25_23705 [Bacillus sp. MRMR6]
MYPLNRNFACFQCIKCKGIYRDFDRDYVEGCPVCLEKGEPASVSIAYKHVCIKGNGKRLFRYSDMLPFETFPTLGEGDIPHIKLEKLSRKMGLKNLWIKHEGQNPTGSHKDRMSPFIIARAKSLGMKTVAVASSGNAGVSIATYAASEDLACVVLTTPTISAIWKQAIEKTGAKLIYKQDALARWSEMKEMVRKKEWYPATNYLLPPVGSNPFGIQGYKTIAYEIIEDFPQLPHYIFVPTARGDMLWGIWKGFEECMSAGIIDSIPRLVAVEPLPRLERVFQGELYTNVFNGTSTQTPSVSGNTVTYQALQAIQNSSGKVVTILSEQAESAQLELGMHGIYAERSSALVYEALRKLVKSKEIKEEDRVLLIISSNGYKELL